MKFIKYIFLALIITLPVNVFGGGDNVMIDTDEIASYQLSAPYDLRNRKTYIQVSVDANNSSPQGEMIHVQIFQHDRNCTELNFEDTLTPNDTVIYDLDNLIKNDGSAVPASLLEDSYGYVVISTHDGSDGQGNDAILGNVRIIDNNDYEYRANMAGHHEDSFDTSDYKLTANFNTIAGAMYADVIGYAYEGDDEPTVTNIEEGFTFDIFTFDMDEEPLSCDHKNFACGNVMNYGINEDYRPSREDNLLCPGAQLADPQGGFVSFENGANLDFDGTERDDDTDDVFVGWIGINNNNGTGALDLWWYSDDD